MARKRRKTKGKKKKPEAPISVAVEDDAVGEAPVAKGSEPSDDTTGRKSSEKVTAESKGKSTKQKGASKGKSTKQKGASKGKSAKKEAAAKGKRAKKEAASKGEPSEAPPTEVDSFEEPPDEEMVAVPIEVEGDVDRDAILAALIEEADEEVVAVSIDEDEEEVVAIEVDDEIDSDEERKRLIAEALAFVEREEGGVQADTAPPEGSEDQGETRDVPSREGAEGQPDEVSGVGVEADLEVQPVGESGDEGGPEGPLFTADALRALTELRSEGLSHVPRELILDLGEATTDEERDRLLAAAMAHSEMREAIYRVPTDTGQTRRWKGLIASAILFVAMIVAARPPGIIVPNPPSQLTDADRVRGVHVTLLLQAQQIEAYRTREERLPDSLDDVAVAFPGVRFVRSGSRLYQLVAYQPNGDAVVYDAAAPAPEFERIARAWATTRGDS